MFPKDISRINLPNFQKNMSRKPKFLFDLICQILFDLFMQFLVKFLMDFVGSIKWWEIISLVSGCLVPETTQTDRFYIS